MAMESLWSIRKGRTGWWLGKNKEKLGNRKKPYFMITGKIK